MDSETPSIQEMVDDVAQAQQELPREAGELMARIMISNAHANADIFEQLLEGEKHAHEQTKVRLRATKGRLDTIQRRMDWVFGGSDLWEEDLWPEDRR